MHGIKIPLQDFVLKMQGGAPYLWDTTVIVFIASVCINWNDSIYTWLDKSLFFIMSSNVRKFIFTPTKAFP